MRRIVRLSDTVSTNADAMRFARNSEALPLWVVAERQSGGRGRSGREWVSLPGNLHASMAIESQAPLIRAGELSLVAGLAAYDAVRSLVPAAGAPQLRLKWPNDLLIGNAKTGGILVESATRPDRTGFIAVIGFGLNVVSVPEDLRRSVTALADHFSGADAEGVLQALVVSMDASLGLWDEGRGFDRVRTGWLAASGPLGEAISINTLEGPVRGAYAGLTDSGALRIDCGGTVRDFNYGDVALVTDAAKDRLE